MMQSPSTTSIISFIATQAIKVETAGCMKPIAAASPNGRRSTAAMEHAIAQKPRHPRRTSHRRKSQVEPVQSFIVIGRRKISHMMVHINCIVPLTSTNSRAEMPSRTATFKHAPCRAKRRPDPPTSARGTGDMKLSRMIIRCNSSTTGSTV